MAEKLTESQQAAIDNRGGRLLVSAAAGSGKTKVLVDRLMKYLMDPVAPANIDEFLIITFTKSAAAELRTKIASKLSERIAEDPDNRHLQRQLQRLYMTQISTVHSFCANLLRKYAYKLDIPADFRVAEDNEVAALRMACADRVLEESYADPTAEEDLDAVFATLSVARSDENMSDILLKMYEKSMCHPDPDQWLEHCAQVGQIDGVTDPAETVWGKYILTRTLDNIGIYAKMLERCAALAMEMGTEIGAVDTLNDNFRQADAMRQCTTWEQLRLYPAFNIGTLRFSKQADTDMKETIKVVRKIAVDGVRAELQNVIQSTDRILKDISIVGPATRGLVKLVQRFTKRYNQEKHRLRWMDYSDLEQLVLDLLVDRKRGTPTNLALQVGSSYREVMVDEYQDANAVQDSIYMALTHSGNNCFMVGDMKQSIYQFRLADPGIFLEKYHAYLPAETAEDPQGRKIILSSNFRSGGEILEATNSVFEICMSPAVGGIHYGEKEALQEGIEHDSLGEAAVELLCIQVRHETYAEEASCVVERIMELLDGTHMVRGKDGLRPIRPGDIAILLRSPSTNSGYFVHELAKYGIRCTGGSSNLLDAREIQLLHSLLQCIYNPQQDIPLAAVLLSPVFALTADDLAKLRGQYRYVSLFDAMCRSDDDRIVSCWKAIKHLRTLAPRLTVCQLIEEIYACTHMDTVFSSMDDGAQRSENLQIFFQFASGFDSWGGGNLGQFLDHLSRMGRKGITAAAESANEDCVSIVSIHSSKGLEYPVVILAGLAKTFNKDDLYQQVLSHKTLGIGLDAVDHGSRSYYPTLVKDSIKMKMEEELLSEELRILYVAMTRARDRLIMSYASKYLKNQLEKILCMDSIGCQDYVIRNTPNIGNWVLLAALRRTEAGELFALAGPNPNASVRQKPWRIRVLEAVAETEEAILDFDVAKPQEQDISDVLQQVLSFRYEHEKATKAPSKQTATQLKGRLTDNEAAENTHIVPAKFWWRTPGDRQIGGKDRGNAVHTVMQYLPLADCAKETDISRHIDEMVVCGKLTPQQAELVNVGQIYAFLSSPLGNKLRTHSNVIREFKFSILEDGQIYDPDLVGEKILLQGVVDCAMIESDGITVIDFKTDRVDRTNIDQATQRYRAQVEAYARAMGRIYKLPVKEKWLYYFSVGEFVKL